MKRLLNFHARVALTWARLNGVLEDPTWDFMDYASDGEYAAKSLELEHWVQGVARERQEESSGGDRSDRGE